jgi:hypothetical protein
MLHLSEGTIYAAFRKFTQGDLITPRKSLDDQQRLMLLRCYPDLVCGIFTKDYKSLRCAAKFRKTLTYIVLRYYNSPVELRQIILMSIILNKTQGVINLELI